MKTTIKHWVIKNRFALIVTAVYFLVNLIVILNHEPWTDEANPYLIAKYIGFDNFFEIIRGEPHPILWTLILAPFAKLGLPLVASHIISLLIMTMAVWLLAKYAPFPKLAKVIVILSAAFFYFNPVISRDYCLVPLSAVLVCMAYKDRFRHPLRYSFTIAFLLQTHFLAAGLAAVLYIVFAVECLKKHVAVRKLAASMAIVGASVALAFLGAVGSLRGQVIIQETTSCCGAGSTSQNTPPITEYFPAVNASVFGMAVAVMEVSLALILFYLLLRQRRQFVYLLVAILGNFVVLSFIYGAYGNPQKDAINLIFILVAFWTIYYDKPKDIFKKFQKKLKKMATAEMMRRVAPISVFIFTFPFAMSIPNTMMATVHDLAEPFGASMIIADYLNENLPEGSVIVVPSYGGLATLTVVGMELKDGRILWDALNAEPFKFIDYTLPTRVSPYVVGEDEIGEVVARNFGNTDKLYYLNNGDALEGWTLMHEFPRIDNKYFSAAIPRLYLYKIN
jgi:hypothetical protein